MSTETPIINEKYLAHLSHEAVESLARKLFYGLSDIRDRLAHVDFKWLNDVHAAHEELKYMFSVTTETDRLKSFSETLSNHIDYLSSLEYWINGLYAEFQSDFASMHVLNGFALRRVHSSEDFERDCWLSVQRHIVVMVETYTYFDRIFQGDPEDLTKIGHLRSVAYLTGALRDLRLEIDMQVAECFISNMVQPSF